MGEKFDTHIESGTLPGRFPQFADPTGPGFPAAQYAQMAAGGARWRQAFGAYDQRRVDDVVQMCNDTRERLARAGADEGSRLAALRDAENRLTAGLGDLELHGNQSDMTLQMLSREGTIPTSELKRAAGNTRPRSRPGRSLPAASPRCRARTAKRAADASRPWRAGWSRPWPRSSSSPSSWCSRS
jgi:hypothetical protein